MLFVSGSEQGAEPEIPYFQRVLYFSQYLCELSQYRGQSSG